MPLTFRRQLAGVGDPVQQNQRLYATKRGERPRSLAVW
jgi:hypothetical protein